MKLILLSVGGEMPQWLKEARDEFEKKISHLFPFEFCFLKSPKFARGHQDLKKKKETELLMSFIQPEDLVYLLDERGKNLNTMELSRKLERDFHSGKQRLVVVVGGAFGTGPDLHQRADFTLALSSLVLSHHVALTVAFEQIYRVLSIQHNLPYHNV